jgi:hypothetical protein
VAWSSIDVRRRHAVKRGGLFDITALETSMATIRDDDQQALVSA